eukprot:431128-Alexandrium_andersonii.AAC.1
METEPTESSTSLAHPGNMKHRLRRSELELRGAKRGLKVRPRTSRGVRCAHFLALLATLTMNGTLLRVPR